MKNAISYLNENSHNYSGSSESEINRVLKAKNSNYRFQYDLSKNKNICSSNYKLNNKEKSEASLERKDPVTSRFLNKSITQYQTPTLIQYNKERLNFKYDKSQDVNKEKPSKILKVSLNPFPSTINTRRISHNSPTSLNFVIYNSRSHEKNKDFKIVPNYKTRKNNFLINNMIDNRQAY